MAGLVACRCGFEEERPRIGGVNQAETRRPILDLAHRGRIEFAWVACFPSVGSETSRKRLLPDDFHEDAVREFALY